ncbi:hypothetical protein P255_01213 [Acinetobacter brisouii CIP 110357]|uniref:DUF4365 domain-containing protein n=1 Tax=Acinetobacter brisouii CIP 110357 TaxID=1341683 RepID=V2VVN9_9GAMM|nr:hypothetical protein [Acinetobacter brisouii]ENV48332.1 hypothetical protein F954_01400 [Acinetobacter brisouii ANC 4119]ESK51784.1 hypothetical protein P255_01213 [Acinetobacter brisouii CIP 110357]
MRDLGQLGESTFEMWCAQVGLIANGSAIDKTGWDYYVEFPISSNVTTKELHKSAFECKVQVKATDKQDRKLPITISNLRRMATAQMPTFYAFLEFDGKNEVQNAFILHIDNDLVFKILKKIHEIEQSESEKDKNLNKRKMTLFYNEQHKLEKLDGNNLKETILKYIGENYSEYIVGKNKYLQDCGFEDESITMKFSIEGEDGIQKIIDVSLGLEKEFNVKNLISIEKRFGIPDKKSQVELSNAKLSLDMLPPKRGKIRFKEDNLSYGLVFDIDFYNSPFNSSKEFKRFLKFRLINDLFDIIFEPYAGKVNYKFNLWDKNRRFELKILKDAIALINIMSRDNQKIIVELEIENLNTLTFDFKSKYVKRDLGVFDELLSKVLQICFQAKIYEEITISIQELYHYKQEIEQFHTLITKSDRCDFMAEFELKEKLTFNKAAFIAVITCRLGSHTLGMIYTIFGEIKETSKYKFRIESVESVIEKTFIYISNTDDVNLLEQDLLKSINHISSKYEDKYNVIYNWN